jgi:hypothetical protein
MKNHIVVGFPIDIDDNIDYNALTDRQKHELALSNDDAIIYDNPKDFFAELNEDLVDTENVLWFLIKR